MVFSCEFPIYCARPGGQEGELVVAGGGGQSKTGVPNAIEVRSVSHTARGVVVSECLHHHDLGPRLVMDFDLRPGDPCTLATGIGHTCNIMQLKSDGGARKKQTDKDEDSEEVKVQKVKVQEMGCVQTDFGAKDAYQKVVRFTALGSKVVTGGMDGVVRVWKYPGLERQCELCDDSSGGGGEVEDLACSPVDENQVVVVHTGGGANVWSLAEPEVKVQSFDWSPDKKTAFRFRACRFSPPPPQAAAAVKGGGGGGGDHTPHLFTLAVPLKWSYKEKRCRCYLVKFDSALFEPVSRACTGRELLCAMAIDSIGKRVAVATTEGTVLIYSAANLKPLATVAKVHAVFVTGLAFIRVKPEKQDSKPIKPVCPDEVLLSVSADRTCSVVTENQRRGLKLSLILFVLLPLLVLLVAATFLRLL